MKKRLISLVLLTIMLFLLTTGIQADTSLCFVAMNDAVPLTLTGGAAPYYSSGKLFLPYTAFQINPNQVGASYNAEKGTFVLFNSQQILIFNLEAGTYTDNKEQTYEVELAYRGGLLYVPASVASHFGLSVTMLTSRAGYPIIRFTNGEQVYDDGMFVAQAENLITHVAQEYHDDQNQQITNPDGNQINPDDPIPPEDSPAEIYLAFVGDAVSAETVQKLSEHQIRAAFFLTESQITLERDLVRAICAGGHTIGITVNKNDPDYMQALQLANEALDNVLFFRSVFALLPTGSVSEQEAFRILTEPATVLTVEESLRVSEEPQLYLVRNGALGVIESFVNAGATLPQLLETTFLQ